MKFLPRLPFDQVGDAPGRPKRGAISQHFRAFFESAAQVLQLFGKQPRFATGPTGFEQGFGSLSSPGLVPPANRLPMDAQSAGYLALAQSTVEESGGLESPSFQAIKIALHAFWIAHAQTIARVSERVTILCKRQ
jgi:hypothetical protein